MDFSSFRTNTDLSDVTVVVENEEFFLHSFPLYACSDFFRQLAERHSPGARIVLADFPGGAAIFSLVADHCYGVRVVITADNVCQLRCAADYLGMRTGEDNLANRSDDWIDNTLAAARLSSLLTTPVELLQRCRLLGEPAEKVGIIKRCIDTIMETWSVTHDVDMRKIQPQLSEDITAERLDAKFFRYLCQLPVNWIVQLFMAGRDKPINSAILAEILQAYVGNVIGEHERHHDTASSTEAKTMSSSDEVIEKDEETAGEGNGVADAAIREALDLILTELPIHSSIVDSIPALWAISTLQTTERYGCRSRSTLLAVSARLFHGLNAHDICRLQPELICELARAAIDDCGGADDVCLAIDRYLTEMAGRDELTTELFNQVVSAVPAEKRTSHDTLFDVLEILLKSDQTDTATDEQKRTLMEAVDFRRLSEDTLQRAYDSALVPAAYITKAALALCTRLRAELTDARVAVESQAAQLHHLRQRAHATTVVPAPIEMLRYDRVPATTGSHCPDLDLQLAMDALGKAYISGPSNIAASMPPAVGRAYDAYRYGHYLADRHSAAPDAYRYVAARPAHVYTPRTFIW